MLVLDVNDLTYTEGDSKQPQDHVHMNGAVSNLNRNLVLVKIMLFNSMLISVKLLKTLVT